MTVHFTIPVPAILSVAAFWLMCGVGIFAFEAFKFHREVGLTRLRPLRLLLVAIASIVAWPYMAWAYWYDARTTRRALTKYREARGTEWRGV